MILIDSKQMFYHAVDAAGKRFPGLPITNDVIRPEIISLIYEYKKVFYPEFGQIVIAVDTDGPSWRSKINPYYRWRRKTRKSRSSGVDMSAVRSTYKSIIEEINKYIQIPLINIRGVEADDIIAALVIEHKEERNLVVSIDHDFEQLLKYPNLTLFRPKRYDPSNILNGTLYNSSKRYNSYSLEYKKVSLQEAEEIRLVHVIKGDQGDDICNLLSEADTYYKGVRQTVMSPKRYSLVKEQVVSGNFTDENVKRRYEENLIMVDFDHIPDEIYRQIIDSFEFSRNRVTRGYSEYIKDFDLLNLQELPNIFEQ